MPFNNFKASDFVIDFIKMREGFSPIPYIDDKKDTSSVEYSIGYGHQILPFENRILTNVSKSAAEDLLRKDVNKFEKAVNESVNIILNQNQFDALLSFTYNVGISAFKSSTLLKKINANASRPEIEAEFRKWVYSKSVQEEPLPALIKRREAEINIYFAVIPQDTKKKSTPDSCTQE